MGEIEQSDSRSVGTIIDGRGGGGWGGFVVLDN